MKRNQAEGILLEQYTYPDFLPPLWRIIFQEAMRGNHLLFSLAVQQEAFEDNFPSLPESGEEQEHPLVAFCVNLYAAPDLKTIRSMIALLPKSEQKQLFAIYQRQMASLRDENKMSLN